MVAGDRAVSASKSHSQAEKRRRDRINAQLTSLRKLIPKSDKFQNVRVRFIPTEKKDIRDIYAAPNQRPTIYDMHEKTVDEKYYYSFEYVLTSPNYLSASFATIAIGNGRYWPLIVGANERRWKRYRD
ncbi:hypothetical protein HN51_054890 [Arachis hypogaea]